MTISSTLNPYDPAGMVEHDAIRLAPRRQVLRLAPPGLSTKMLPGWVIPRVQPTRSLQPMSGIVVCTYRASFAPSLKAASRQSCSSRIIGFGCPEWKTRWKRSRKRVEGGPCVLFLHAFGREGFRIPPSDNNFLPSFQVFV